MNQQGDRGKGGQRKDGKKLSKDEWWKRQQQQQQQQGSQRGKNQWNKNNQNQKQQQTNESQNFQTPPPPKRDDVERKNRRKKENQKEMMQQERAKTNQAKEFQFFLQQLSFEDNQWLDNYNKLVQQYDPLSNYLSRLRIQDDQYLDFYNLVHILTRNKIQDKWFQMEILKSATFNIQVTEICSIFSQQADDIDFFQQEMEKLLKLFVWMFRGSETTFRQSCVSSIFNLQKIIECYYEKHDLSKLFNEYDKFLKMIYKTAEPIQYMNSPSYPVALEFIQIDPKKDQQLFGKLEKLNVKDITLEKYFDYHYFVIREDYIRNLRQAISSLSETGFEEKINRESTSNINLYQNMQLISAAMNNYEIIWGITLEQFNMDGRIQKKIDWFRSKRLSSGNLICLTNIECYPLIFGVITNREERQPFYEKDKKIQLEFKLLDPNVLMMSFLNLFSQKTIIIEYEDLVDPIISYLEALKSKDQSFPFQNILVNGDTSVSYPKYLNKGYTWQIDISNTHYYRGTELNIFQEPWPNLQCTLDQSQQEAIKLILRKEVALIQGPPGTGKTYCGALAVRILFQNLNAKDFPIMIVCYTNHALDQFLEHIIKFVPLKDVARLGGSCKHPELKKCQFRCQTQIRDFEWDNFKQLKLQIYDILDRKLSYKYKVTSKDIKYTWPELWERLIQQFLENNHLEDHHIDKSSEHVIVTCWLEGKKPTEEMLVGSPFLNGMYDYYTNERITIDFQIKKFLRKETTQIIQKRQDSSDEDLDEYMDSEDEPIYRNNLYMDESPKETIKKITDAIKEFNKYNQNSDDLYYDYEGIQRIRIDIQGGNPWLLHQDDIWEIIRYIKCLKYQEDSVQFDRKYKEFQEMSKQLKGLYDQNEIYQLNQKKIIGVTITGVARQVKKLQKLNTKVMIIEEAAEVLESHIVSVLTPNLQHLILIGDHQQLKPKLKCYELEKKMEANVSLFEKLFKNKISSVTLSQQRRMKPSFADFIRLIYGPKYEDHANTLKKQQIEIKGITKDLVFFNHKWLENSQESSKENKKEGEMIFSMVQYLLNIGYDQTEISVLTLYLRQAQTIKKKFQNAKQFNIKVQTVDNYQGEENEIVILSLVRNNLNRQLGYIKIENRINVALSRAKHGLYVFGNFDFIYENSEIGSLWQRVIDLAKQKQCLQNTIQAKCLNQGHIIDICNPEDWDKTMQGNCKNKCQKQFQNCVHICKKMCHPGDHSQQNCPENCERLIDCGHKCTKLCREKCQCTITVVLGLNCGHSVQAICGTDPYTINCQMQQEAFFKKCNHNVKYQCYQKDQYIYFCKHVCDKQLQCGHKCQKLCYENCLPCKQTCKKERPCGHQNECIKFCCEPCSPCKTIVNYELKCGHKQQFKCGSLQEDLKIHRCEQPCKLQSMCNHKTQCPKKCYEQCSPCILPCQKQRPCGHTDPCINICNQNCSPCQELINKTLDCGHIFKVKCSDFTKPINCDQKCTKKRQCGHDFPCNQICSSICTPCQTPVDVQLACGHSDNFICHSKALEIQRYQCKKPCKRDRVCGHKLPCHNLCHQICSPCSIQVIKTLVCGHTFVVNCSDFNKPVICEQKCIKVRVCGHNYPCSLKCNQNCDPCKVIVNVKLQCQHEIQVECYNKTTFLLNYLCKEACNKPRLCGHNDPCNNFCYLQKECTPCFQNVKKTLNCGHEADVQCFQKQLKVLTIDCKQPCKKLRPCGHDFPCDKLCLEVCTPCCKIIDKPQKCGHKLKVQCSFTGELQCTMPCIKKRDCGHSFPCNKRCYEYCSPCGDVITRKLVCGHNQDLVCHKKHLNIPCSQQCKKLRACGHQSPCINACGSIFCSPCEEMVQKFCSNCLGTRMVKCSNFQFSECDLQIKLTLKCKKHTTYVKCCLSKQADLKCKECGDCVIF